MWHARLDESQPGIKITRRNINNLSYADDTTLTTKSEEELNSFLTSGKRREWKSWLKNSTFKKLRSWYPGPILLWHIEWENVEAVKDFIFLGFWITVDCECNYEIKRHLLLGRKAMKILDCVLQSRGITLLIKVHMVKAVFFPSCHVWRWELDHKESWALKNWCFRIVVLEKAVESPLDCKEIKPVNSKGNQPWIFIGRTDA